MSEINPKLERIDYLANRITEMTLGEVRPSNLGNIAIELLVARERAEEKLEGNYSENEKEEAQETLKQIKALEKNVIRLYFLSTLKGETRGKMHPFDRMVAKYVK